MKPTTYERISYKLKTRVYNVNEIVFKTGEPVNKLYIVSKGEVQMFINVMGEEVELDTLYKGCIIN